MKATLLGHFCLYGLGLKGAYIAIDSSQKV